MFSTSDMEEDIRLSLQYKQVVEYIEKPFDLQKVEALFDKIDGWIFYLLEVSNFEYLQLSGRFQKKKSKIDVSYWNIAGLLG